MFLVSWNTASQLLLASPCDGVLSPQHIWWLVQCTSAQCTGASDPGASHIWCQSQYPHVGPPSSHPVSTALPSTGPENAQCTVQGAHLSKRAPVPANGNFLYCTRNALLHCTTSQKGGSAMTLSPHTISDALMQWVALCWETDTKSKIVNISRNFMASIQQLRPDLHWFTNNTIAPTYLLHFLKLYSGDIFVFDIISRNAMSPCFLPLNRFWPPIPPSFAFSNFPHFNSPFPSNSI